MATTTPPEKRRWTEDDFDTMGWHDCAIHAIAYDPEAQSLLLDVDYIFEWLSPDPGERTFAFHVAPATLVFHNVREVALNNEPYADGPVQIDGVSREPLPRRPDSGLWSWTVRCHSGHIAFVAGGFTMTVRDAPTRISRQYLLPSERGGFSFAVPPPTRA